VISPCTRAAAVFGCVVLTTLSLTACGATPIPTHGELSSATSAKDVGGMDALVAAAKKEGRLNAVAFPRDWASYGALIDGFSKKYGIKVKVTNANGTSQDEINAVKKLKGKDSAPDVLDVGTTFAQAAARKNLLAPYKVEAYDKIPSTQKDWGARWYNNYGGYMSIGCDANRVNTCPETFTALLNPAYKGKVALNGDPTTSGSAFSGVFAAALANKGSFDDVRPGVDFFAKLKKIGNFNPIQSTPASVEKGQTPITIDWDYLNSSYADEFRRKGVNWQVAVPTDGVLAQYYSDAINRNAPHPAAARLWQEYVFRPEGQNLRLDGYARPVLMDVMKRDGTLDEVAAAWLPTVEGTPTFPTATQITKAKDVIARSWSKAVSH
jgi:putative spermidine/putrescine transport system substrate-binding protein